MSPRRRNGPLSSTARLAAGAVALTGFAGLAIQFNASLGLSGSAGAAIWAMLRFFTIIGNLLAALLFAGIAFGIRSAAQPRIVGGAALIMALIGIVYATLLHGMIELSGGAELANIILHKVTPVLAALYWLFFTRKGGLAAHDIIGWTAIPLAYFVYALARAQADGKYPYPFMNAATLGWPRTLINAGVIALGFLLAGAVLYWLDHMLGRLFRTARR